MCVFVYECSLCEWTLHVWACVCVCKECSCDVVRSMWVQVAHIGQLCARVCMCVSLWSWAQLWYGKFSSGYSYIILSVGRSYSHLRRCALVTSSSSEPLVICGLNNTEMMPLGPFRIKRVTNFCNTLTQMHTFLIFSQSLLLYSSVYSTFDR